MMQVINTLLGRRASSRHRVEVPITWKVPWGQGRQKMSSPSLAQHAGGAGPTLAVLPGGSVGLETHLTFLVGVLVPVMVWFSCHGSVVPGIKNAQFWYRLAPECKPRGHYFIYSGAGAQGDGGGSFSDRCLYWYVSRVSMLLPN